MFGLADTRPIPPVALFGGQLRIAGLPHRIPKAGAPKRVKYAGILARTGERAEAAIKAHQVAAREIRDRMNARTGEVVSKAGTSAARVVEAPIS
jgi:hypothetical protein